jgi:hypothetical protein
MQQLIETAIGNLPPHLVENSAAVTRLVIEEIERALPMIISEMKMPSRLDESILGQIRYRLKVGKGFRPYTPTRRKQAVEQLQHEAYLRSLRKIQEVASLDLRTNSNKDASRSEPVLESANTITRGSIEPADTRILVAASLTPAELQPDATFMGDPKISPLQEDASFPTANSVQLDTPTGIDKSREDLLKLPNVPIELHEPVAQRDVRRLLALFRDSKLITFVEPETGTLVPATIEKIQVPGKKVYRSLNIEELVSEYHSILESHSSNLSEEVATELRLLDALLSSLENEAQWSRINNRRFHLITKKHSLGLTPLETEELNELQALADKQADSAQNLPFVELAMLKDYARKLGFGNPDIHYWQ